MAGRGKKQRGAFSAIMLINIAILLVICCGLGIAAAISLHVDRVPDRAGFVGQVAQAWRAMTGDPNRSSRRERRQGKRNN